MLLPLSLYLNWRLAILLFVLCGVFTVLTTIVVRKTHGMQSEVEEHYSGSRRTRLRRARQRRAGAELRAHRRRGAGPAQRRQRLLSAQMPVLSWWAMVSVMTRASTTITILAIFVVGIVLHAQGLATIGEMVMFVNFATMLINKLEQVVGFINSIFMEAPRLQQFYEVLDATPAVRDRSDAIDPGRLSGLVEFNDVSFSYDGKRPAVEDLDLHGAARADHRAGRPDRRRQVHRDRAAASRVRSAVRHHQDRRHGRARR